MGTICIDYDGTYSTFSSILDVLIHKAKEDNHRVIVCTLRYEHEREDAFNELERKVDAVYFTGRKSKGKFLEAKGESPDIWIDDNPLFVYVDAY